MEKDKTVTASFTTAFWIAPSAWSLWLPKNDLNLQILLSLFSGSLYYSQVKKEIEMSAAAFMTDSVGKIFLLRQDGAYYPSEPVKCERDSGLSFHFSPCVYSQSKQFTLPFIVREVVAYAFCLKMIAWRVRHLIPS